MRSRAMFLVGPVMAASMLAAGLATEARAQDYNVRFVATGLN